MGHLTLASVLMAPSVGAASATDMTELDCVLN